MDSGVIDVFIQPDAPNSFWVNNIRIGISDGARHHKDYVHYHDATQITDVSDTLFNFCNQPVLVVGNNISWISSVIRLLIEHGAKPIVVNASMLSMHKMHCSGVVFDLEEIVRCCVCYLNLCEKKRIVFLGANPLSVTDSVKCDTFGSLDDIVYADNGIESGIKQFLDNFSNTSYDAALCFNDTVAIYLEYEMKKQGYELPKDFFIVGMGNSYIGANVNPSLTSVMFNYREMGVQAINLYHNIINNPLQYHVLLSLPCRLVVRQSTGNIPVKILNNEPLSYDVKEKNFSNEFQPHSNYFSGTVIQNIINMESLLQTCQPSDREILFRLLNGESCDEIAKCVFFYTARCKVSCRKISTGLWI